MTARRALSCLSLALVCAGPAFAMTRHKPAKLTKFAQAVLAPDPTPPPAAPEKPSMTLLDALGIAYETNPDLAGSQAGQRATDEKVAQANGAWRPTISLQASYGVEKYFFPGITITGFGTITSVNDHPINGAVILSQPIFRSGRTIAEIRRAKALVGVGRAQLTAAEQTVLLNAVTAYMNVVRDTAIVTLREHNVAVLRKQKASTELEFKAGSLTRTDVAQSVARLANAESDLTNARGQLAISRADFLKTIGRPAETLERHPDLPRLASTEDDVLGVALKQNPSLLAAQSNERAAQYAVNDAWGALGPTFGIQAQYQYSQSVLNSVTGFGSDNAQAATDHTVAVVGQLNVPIYQAGVEESVVREARQLHDQAKLGIVSADRQVRDSVEAAWSNFQSALATIASNESTVKADEVAFEGVSKEQQVGARTVLDVLNAEQELLNAQVAVVSSQSNAVVAAYQVLAASGGLTAKALNLKVKLYDPLEYYDDNADRWFGFGD